MHYINRELSWLAFNQRVLYEALDLQRSLDERLKFLAIFSSNLDEFFMIRVGALDDQIFAGYTRKDLSGMRPKETMAAIRREVLHLTTLQSEVAQHIFEDLKGINVRIYSWQGLTEKHLRYLERYFMEEVFPTLTPMAVDFGRPFPLILNKSLNILVKLKGDIPRYLTMQIPSFFNRLVTLGGDQTEYIWIEDLIQNCFHLLLDGYEVEASCVYRITRNGDITIEDEVAEDLLRVIEASLKQRKWGDVLRLEIPTACNEELRAFLCQQFEITEDDIYPIKGPLDLTIGFKLSEWVSQDQPQELFKPVKIDFTERSIFEWIQAKDRLLHHPFQTFDPVVHFIEAAAKDPEVLAIKQVLYRVGGNSPIVKALQVASDAGKQVTVLLELKARFDEENNIQWAKLLEKNGCHVIYGIEGIKTHAKITLVVRKESDGIRRYVHVSSGNYNDKTAKLYTDVSLFTCHEQIAQDASKFFNILSGYVNETQMQHLVAAPAHLKPVLIQLIETEAEYAKIGRPASIIAKMNALVDGDVINALYKASKAGVKIRLIIRGICCLVPQKTGLSENIWVKSIVDDYLEHTRLFYFHHNGSEQVYLSSADWMPRNLERRIELLTPIFEYHLKKHVLDVLELYWKTQKKAHVLLSNGLYQNCIAGDQDLSCQKQLEKLYLALPVDLD